MPRATSAVLVLAVLAGMGAGASAASAADLSGHPLMPGQSLIPEEIGTGWYLRGDIGYGFNDIGGVRNATADFGALAARDGITGGIGFGYQFNEMIRADVTLDRLNKVDLSGATTCASWSVDCDTPATATAERTRLDAYALLANVYADLGTWYGVTPYVGAGIGAAYVDIAGHSSVNADASGSRLFGAREGWTLAAGAAAGASYTIGDGLVLDLGYRFLWVDSARSGAALGAEAGDIRAHDLTAHQVRAGLRYYLF